MLEFLMLFWTIPTALVGFTLFFNIIFFNGSLIRKSFKIMAVTYYIFFILIILFLVIECNIIEHLTV